MSHDKIFDIKTILNLFTCKKDVYKFV